MHLLQQQACWNVVREAREFMESYEKMRASCANACVQELLDDTEVATEKLEAAIKKMVRYLNDL